MSISLTGSACERASVPEVRTLELVRAGRVWLHDEYPPEYSFVVACILVIFIMPGFPVIAQVA